MWGVGIQRKTSVLGGLADGCMKVARKDTKLLAKRAESIFIIPLIFSSTIR